SRAWRYDDPREELRREGTLLGDPAAAAADESTPLDALAATAIAHGDPYRTVAGFIADANATRPAGRLAY
ncbi:MAG: hypothetical protein JXA69_09200, partial [Phycisphaerae bacterium]|nr:hypothetical protein [Phycisphaerae bacterium]